MTVYTVSQISAKFALALSTQFPAQICVVGEISNFSASKNGHWYFTLKDTAAQISMVMFKNDNSRMTFLPKNGMQIKIFGEVSFYRERGQCQIICQSIHDDGVGNILKIIEERKEKLKREGLFDAEHKKPFPRFPLRIGILTSSQAAALQDILRTFSFYAVVPQIVLFHASVQGESAVPEMLRQLTRISKLQHPIDLLLISRGGGSTEDLLPYSDENLIRAIFKCPIPIITGIGHEVDSPLCELVADIRCPTPTAAASRIAEQIRDTTSDIVSIKESLKISISSTLTDLRYRVQKNSISTMVRELRQRVLNKRQHIDVIQERIQSGVSRVLREIRTRIQKHQLLLTQTSPSAVLQRGYALVYKQKDRTLISSAAMLAHNDAIEIQFKDGRKKAEITERSMN